MKLAGIILIIAQLISFIPSMVTGENPFAGGIPYLIGRFSFLIIGVILLIIAKKKGKNNKDQ